MKKNCNKDENMRAGDDGGGGAANEFFSTF